MPNLCPIRKKVLLILVKVNIKRKQTFAKVTGNSHAKRRHRNPTSFVTPDGFRFTVLPFDLSNAAATFSRMMRVQLNDLNTTICFVYVILIHTEFSHDQINTKVFVRNLGVKPFTLFELCRTFHKGHGHTFQLTICVGKESDIPLPCG